MAVTIKPADEIERLKATLAKDPDDTGVRRRLAGAYLRQGRRQVAAAELRRIVEREPDNASAMAELGALMASMQRPRDGALLMRRAIELGDARASTLSNLGAAMTRSGEVEAAVDLLQQASSMDPSYADAPYNLGIAEKSLARTERAIEALERAVAINPRHAGALFALQELARPDPGESLVRDLQAAVDDAKTGEDDRAHLHFALGQVYERAGEYATAWPHFETGNAIRKRRYAERNKRYDPAAHEALVDDLIRVFDKGFLAERQDWGIDDDRAVFVVGMPRSGTTLVEQILASHPAGDGIGETSEIDRIAQGLPRATLKIAVGGDVPVKLDHEPSGYPSNLGRIKWQDVEARAQSFLKRLGELAPGAGRVVEKTPFNYLYVGFIQLLYPASRVIHCRRDPVDTCLSCFLQDFVQAHMFANDLAHLGHYYRQHDRLMDHWRQVVGLPLLDAVYEDVVASTEASVRELVDFAGLGWDDACLRFHETERAVHTASQEQVRRPIYSAAVGRWKRFDEHLGPLLKALGH